MPIDIRVGHAYLVKTPPNGSHLYIAIALLPDSEEKYLFVSTTSKKSDLSCVIRPGENIPSFISQESTICYKRAKEFNALQLARLLDPDSEVPNGIFPDQIIEQIIDGGLRSGRLKNKYKQVLKDWGY